MLAQISNDQSGRSARPDGVLTLFASIYAIRGFPPDAPMLTEDDNCSLDRFAVGSVVQVRDATG